MARLDIANLLHEFANDRINISVLIRLAGITSLPIAQTLSSSSSSGSRRSSLRVGTLWTDSTVALATSPGTKTFWVSWRRAAVTTSSVRGSCEGWRTCSASSRSAISYACCMYVCTPSHVAYTLSPRRCAVCAHYFLFALNITTE